MRGPDFICIGAQRSGTTWLHRSLSHHPELWLTPVKEIHYFSGKAGEKKSSQMPLDLRSPLSQNWVNVYYSNEPPDEAWYCLLFEEAKQQGLLTGESSPSYAILDDVGAASLKRICPETKLIFIMRDPVQRAWSAAMNDWIKKRSDQEPVVEEMLARELRPALFARSSYIDTIQRFEQFFPTEHIHYAFYEDLCAEPVIFLQNILSFLNVDTAVADSIIAPPTKSTTTLFRMPDIFEREYAAHILPSIERLCERFVGPPHAWRSTYKKLLDQN